MSSLLPPSLVIQDELHLISGPLGTMVGVYEALIDFLCREGGRSPLIIGSSATLRRADNQCMNLYGRGITIFPPRALSAESTYFGEPIDLGERPGRLYVGLLPAGFSMKTSLVRALGSLLIDREFLVSLPPLGTPEGNSLRDPYWTGLAYFNSLRELGGALRLIPDDIPAQMKLLVGTSAPAIRLLSYEELDSHKKGYEIPEILDKIERSLRTFPREKVLDLVLATNMISVGVDIQRLGLMVVTGQPKATAEYIQATSRIGRRHPGLVVTLYNWTRPRDRSHYEDFTDYHATLYRHVEVNSVTPYTEPSLRRGLHAVIVGAVRHLEPGMSDDDAAVRFSPGFGVVGRLKTFLMERLKDPRNPTDPAEIVDRMFDQIVDQWAEAARNANSAGQPLAYSGGERSLLIPIEEADVVPAEGMPTLNSLRDVEPSTGLEFNGNKLTP